MTNKIISKKILIIICLIMITIVFSGCTEDNKKHNVHKIINCSDEFENASSVIELLDKNGFSDSYYCKFPIRTTCQQVRIANRIEIIGQVFMHKECIIIN